ncbi:MAG TPA: hypothetical protein VK436_11505 [Methanocella sp.]|nr:hypothetical protein [Methanocella sp.]
MSPFSWWVLSRPTFCPGVSSSGWARWKGNYVKALGQAGRACSLGSGRFEARRALAMSLLVNDKIEKARMRSQKP